MRQRSETVSAHQQKHHVTIDSWYLPLSPRDCALKHVSTSVYRPHFPLDQSCAGARVCAGLSSAIGCTTLHLLIVCWVSLLHTLVVIVLSSTWINWMESRTVFFFNESGTIIKDEKRLCFVCYTCPIVCRRVFFEANWSQCPFTHYFVSPSAGLPARICLKVHQRTDWW